MNRASYQVRLAPALGETAPMEYRYQNHVVRLTPLGLAWSDASGHRVWGHEGIKRVPAEPISSPAELEGEQDPHSRGEGFIYRNAYGKGIHLGALAKDRVFRKIVRMDGRQTFAEVPREAQFLEIPFEIETDPETQFRARFGGSQIRVWDKSETVVVRGEAIELRWEGYRSYIEPAHAWDSAGEQIPIAVELRAEGRRLVLTKYIPLEWLNRAIFPVYADVDLRFGPESVFMSATTSWISTTTLDANIVVAAYADDDNGSFGKAVVGTVTGDIIVFGSPVTFESTSVDYVSVTTLDATHVAIAYRKGASTGELIIGEVSGASITFGSPLSFNAANSTYVSATALDGTHVLIAYTDQGNARQGTAIVGDTDGATTINGFGAPNIYSASFTANNTATALGATQAVIGYQDESDFDNGKAIVAQTDGANTITSFGTTTTFHADSTSFMSSTTLDSTHVVIGFDRTGGFGKVIVGTISGLTISFGSIVIIDEWSFINNVSCSALDSTHFVVGYEFNGNNNPGKAVVGTVTGGDTISLGQAVIFNPSTSSQYVSVTALDATRVVVSYQDGGNSIFGTSRVGEAALESVLRLIGFETGDEGEIVSLGALSSVQSATVRPRSGSFALQQASTASVLVSGLTPRAGLLALRLSFRKPTNPGSNQVLVQLSEGGPRWHLQLLPDGRLQVEQDEVIGLTTTSSAAPLADDTWYTIRIHYDRGAGGFLRVWVDASLQINVTHTTEGAAINRIEILGLSNPNEYFYDDFFIAISESPPPVGQIIPLLPNGPGSQTEFSTTVGSANHWENVDEVPVDDADYNQHEPSTIATDLYALADPPPGTINAVKGIWRRKRGSGASMSDVQHNAWRESGTTDSELVQIGTNWNNYELIWVAPPSSGGSWTTSKLTGLELGVRHNAPGAQDSFVSWTVPMVDYQYVATALRRSVGITATDLNISSRTVQITGTTATFSGPMPDNVGVGDVLQYQVAAVYYLAFIDGRTSDAVYTVRSASGGTPQTAAAGTAVGVYRAYTSLFNWEAQNENDSLDNSVENFDTSTDLVSNNTSIMVACYGDGEDTTSVAIDGWTTGPDNYIKIYTPISLSEVGTSQRHDGKWSTSAYRISNTMNVDSVILVGERYVRIDGIQVDFQKAPATPQVATTDIRGILVRDGNADAAAEFHISNNIVRQTFGTPAQDTAEGILALDNFTGTVPADNADYVAKVWNNIVYGFLGVARAIPFSGDNYGTIYAFNNTAIGDGGAAGSSSYCFDGSSDNANTFFVKNNIAIDATNPYNQVVTGAGSNNNVSDIGDAPPTGARNCEPTFVNKAGDDYHLAPSDTCAQDWGADLSSDFDLAFAYDIDLGGRQTPWDIGADDVLATTAVELVSFETRALDGAVELTWETGSELNNLGFHLYRSEFEGGRYERITSSAIPGLGSSPEGASYSYKDSGLTNGLTYYYKLEDIETTGKTELHGPVSATPQAGASSSDGDSGDGSSDSGSSGSSPGEDGATSLITYGDPSANTLRVLRRSRRQVVLELLTEGFYAEPQDDGTVRITIPDFAELAEAGSPSVPVRRSWVEVIAGRKVKLVSVTARGVEAFTSLRPSDADMPEIVATREGTVRLARRRSRRSVRRRERAAFQRGGLYPSEPARVVSVGFQGEAKKALVELAPLRWDESRGQLLLARRLVVRLSFRAPDPAEHSTDGVRGRRDRRRRSHDSGPVVARLLTTERGLHAVRYEEVLRSRRGVRARALRLSRQGESVAFHLEPSSRRFKPGSTLYFVSEGASANPYGRDAVYELELGRAGETMTVSSAAPSGQATSFYWKTLVREENRLYQAALLEAPDVWLWDWLFGPMVKSYPFEVSGLALSSEPSHVSVWLQGASDFRANPDHHVRVYVNGSLVDDVSWDGKQAKKIDVDLLPGILQEGENRLELENVGDTEAAYSMVMLDRFELRHPQLPVAEGGKLEGIWNESGVAELTGLAAAHVLDVTPGRDAQPRWLTGSQLSADGVLRFRAEEGRRYHAVSPEAVYHPVVSKPKASRLKNVRNRADYLVIGPQAFLQAAQPLLELRRSQGLAVKTAAIEDIYSDFGFGESTPRAVKDFLSYAYHNWKSPSPRYVLLLGDATYDYKDYLGTGVKNQVPPLMVKTRYLWTSSDPTYAAVNGEDLLPDLAIGRLPAATVEEARAMVAKIVAYETGDVTLEGTTVLVADNADRAGNFQADAEEIASGLLSSREVKKIYLSQLSRATTRSAIVEAFDEGASLMSYVGHGGIAIWASENVFNLGDVDSLEPQAQQPLLLTMNCLNGYYHFPYFNSLSEELVKAEGKGAIAAFSPSGLSLNGPANLYHQALLQELFNGSHERLGDAVLAAQVAYAETGGFPELLSIYHLLGDPALRLK